MLVEATEAKSKGLYCQDDKLHGEGKECRVSFFAADLVRFGSYVLWILWLSGVNSGVENLTWA